MIQLNNKINYQSPDVLIDKGIIKTNLYKKQFDNGIINFDFDSKIYGHDQVKQNLIAAQNSKCCFCESLITANSYGDVEHYRPKAGWVQNNEKINKPGYYWLAYEWDNLFFSCQICNQQFKKNFFPLQTENKRARNHREDVENEDPLLIHPTNDNPEEHIEFNQEIPKPLNESIRGKVTIGKLGLDRDALNEKRKRTYNMVRNIYNLAKNYPENPANLKQEAIGIISEYYDIAQQDSTEYASMLRCFFRKNPIDF